MASDTESEGERQPEERMQEEEEQQQQQEGGEKRLQQAEEEEEEVIARKRIASRASDEESEVAEPAFLKQVKKRIENGGKVPEEAQVNKARYGKR
eukprot:753086-Hanusia_phi.AAC.3